MDCVTCKHLVVGDKDLVCGITNTAIPKEYDRKTIKIMQICFDI